MSSGGGRRKVAAVLFDLDGTLIDSIEAILLSFAHTLSAHMPGARLTRRELINTIGVPLPAQMLQFAVGDAALAEKMIATYREHNTALLPAMPLYPYVKETLAELRRRGFPVGLVTSKYWPSLAVNLEAHGLRAAFDLIMAAEDTPRHKPDPMPLLVAAERLRLAPERLAYIGDSVHDLNCANGAGAMAIAALWGPFEAEDLHALRPAYACADLREFLAIPELAKPS